MGYKEVTTLDADTTITIGGVVKKTGKKNPTNIEGFYLGKREVTGGKFTRPGKKDSIYFLRTADGNVGVWGKTDLDRKMNSVTPGAMIRISYAGTTPTPNGDMHKYKVEVDMSNTIEVDDYATYTASNDEDNAEDDREAVGGYEDGPEVDEDENDEEYEAPKTTTRNVASLTGTAADRAKRAQELLSKGRKA